MTPETATALSVGAKAPSFTLEDADGHKVALKDLSGKWVVLYFYPKDMTSGCTLEAIQFTKLLPEFSRRQAVVLGVSPDTCESHRTFIEKDSLEVTLLADPDHATIEKYGAWQEKSMYGRTFMGVKRSTVLVDPKGKVARIWPNVKADGHAQEVLVALRELAGK